MINDILSADDKIWRTFSAEQVDKDKVRIVANIDCPENYNGDPFTLTERIRDEASSYDGMGFAHFSRCTNFQ